MIKGVIPEMKESKPQIGTITRIEGQQRNKKRYNVYVNEEYAFSVHEDVLISCRLLKGKEIDVNEVQLILEEDDKKKAERIGLHYLSYRPRTAKEIELHLNSKDFSSEVIHSLIDNWIEIGYIDDRKFAQQWVEERIRLKKKGRLLLREELKQKGISKLLVDEVMSNVDQEEEFRSCLELAQKKKKTIRDEEERKAKQKLFFYLQRRGYPFELIQSVLLKMEES
jgi:regulatory protein